LTTDHSDPDSLSYRDAGVDIEAGDQLVENIKPFAKRTLREGVLAGIGGFGALFQVPKKYDDPVLVSGTDGVGTKLKLAFALDRHDTVGIDLVAMSVNDILVQGAEPLFFLDYFACGKLDVSIATLVIKGIATGCAQAGCALIGGETAEMPGMYPAGEYDLAGFAVGAVDKSQIIDGSQIVPGDAIIGLASSGAHSNGYSLIRKIVDSAHVPLSSSFDGQTLGETLLTPTRIYVKPVLAALREVRIKGLAHITGGGLVENVPRVLPGNVSAHIEKSAWPRPALFDWLQRKGNISETEMHRVFNCGIGMVAIVGAEHAERLMQVLQRDGEKVFLIGEIRARRDNEQQAVVV
jgi:phosphoribosylformylglycinamidine cyclo-ligase